MPRADDFSPWRWRTIREPPTDAFGVKGAGEAGTVGSLSTSVNAIVDALSVLGIKHIDMPCTPHRVWQAIASVQGGPRQLEPAPPCPSCISLCGRWSNGPESGGGGVDAPLRGIHHETTHECFHCIECVAVPRGRRAGNRKVGAAPILLFTTTRRRSRRKRTVPVLYLEDAGRFVIVASLAGAPRHPACFLNLEANRRVRLQVRGRRFAATARRASVEEKAQLWPRLVAMYPAYEGYQNRTARDLPVVIATPEPEQSNVAVRQLPPLPRCAASGEGRDCRPGPP